MSEPISVYLFTNRNCLVFDESGNQISKYQGAITCYELNKEIALELSNTAKTFYLSQYNNWLHEISKMSFQYLLGLRTREMDIEERNYDR